MRRVVYALLLVLALGAAWAWSRSRDDVTGTDEAETSVEGPGPRGPAASELRGSANDVPPEPAFDPRPVWPPIVGPYRVEVWGSVPVEGATVTARRRDGTILATKTTDASGIAVFDPAPAPEDVIVAVRSDGWSAAAPVEATNPRRLVLAPSLRLEGSVVERWIEAQRVSPGGIEDARPRSRPVPRARVRLSTVLGNDDFVFEAIADGDGRFDFAGVPRAVGVEAGWASYHAATDDGRLRGSAAPKIGESVEIAVTRAVPVRGTVVDAGGRAVRDAAVWVRATGAAGDVGRVGSNAVTDRAGRFDLSVPPLVGTIEVHAEPLLDYRGHDGEVAWAGRFRRSGRSAPFPITKDTPSVDVGRVVLGRAGALIVRVRDGAGATVPDVGVTLERGRVVVPAGDGAAFGGHAGPATFVAGGLEGGAWTVRVRGRNVEATARSVEVVEGEDVAVDVVVVPGRRAKGTVLDADGRPLAGAPIEVLGPAEPPATGWVVVRNATSGDDGTFDLPLLPSGPLRLRVVGAGHATAADGVELGDASTDLRVATTRLGRARLALVTADGRPLPATATVTFGDPAFPDRTTTTDAPIVGGVLVLEGLAAQAGEAAIDVEGYAPFSRRVAVAPGDDVDLGRVVLTTGYRVVGRVTDGRGAAVAHARVVAAGGRLETTTDADGRYVFEGVPDGVVGVGVVAEGYEEAAEKVAVRGGEARLDVVLARAALVEGKVVGKGGDAAGGERLEFVRLDGEEGAGKGDVHALRADDDGTFQVVLPPGRYRVQARELDRLGETLAEVEAERGVTRTLRLTLPR